MWRKPSNHSSLKNQQGTSVTSYEPMRELHNLAVVMPVKVVQILSKRQFDVDGLDEDMID